MFRSAALPRQCEDTYNSSYNTGDAFAGKDSLGSYDGRNVAGRCQCYLAIFPIKSLDGLHRKTDAYCCGALVPGRCARIVGQIHQSIFPSWFSISRGNRAGNRVLTVLKLGQLEAA